MKIAICGSGPLAIEMGMELHKLGASVTLFAYQKLGGGIRTIADFSGEELMSGPWKAIVPMTHHKRLDASIDNSATPTYKEYLDLYLDPLIKDCHESFIIKPFKVERIQKRFLSLSEEVPNRLRLADLFRVTYQVNPGAALSDQMAANPELFESIDTAVVASLKKNIESYEDFDIAIDATGVLSRPLPLGPSQGNALNEMILRDETQVSYGIQELCRDWEKIICEKELVLVGSGETAEFVLSQLKDWLKKDNHKLHLVSTEVNPFANGSAEVKIIIEAVMNAWDSEKTKFEEKMLQWKSLEDYEKAKVPRPAEPTPKIKFYSGYNVTSLDKMMDTAGVFITLERADFRFSGDCAIVDDLKTLPAKRILVATGYSINHTLSQGLRTEFDFSMKKTLHENGLHPEPGFYTLGTSNGYDRYDLCQGLKNINVIRDRILSFFTKVEK